MDTYIFQHMGLGDMILCNGLVRHILEDKNKKEKIYMFSLNRNLRATKFEFSKKIRSYTKIFVLVRIFFL